MPSGADVGSHPLFHDIILVGRHRWIDFTQGARGAVALGNAAMFAQQAAWLRDAA